VRWRCSRFGQVAMLPLTLRWQVAELLLWCCTEVSMKRGTVDALATCCWRRLERAGRPVVTDREQHGQRCVVCVVFDCIRWDDVCLQCYEWCLIRGAFAAAGFPVRGDSRDAMGVDLGRGGGKWAPILCVARRSGTACVGSTLSLCNSGNRAMSS
jgi:hypothetical protein